MGRMATRCVRLSASCCVKNTKEEAELALGAPGGALVPGWHPLEQLWFVLVVFGGSGGFATPWQAANACSMCPLLHAGQAPVLRGGVLFVNGLGCVWSLF